MRNSRGSEKAPAELEDGAKFSVSWYVSKNFLIPKGECL
jgi:hypothetical protein